MDWSYQITFKFKGFLGIGNYIILYCKIYYQNSSFIKIFKNEIIDDIKELAIKSYKDYNSLKLQQKLNVK